MKAGVPYQVIVPSVVTNTWGEGSYTWQIPTSQSLGTDYSIKVSSPRTPIYTDSSDNYFSLTSGGTPSITVTSPNGYESWQRGMSHAITWSYTGTRGRT